MQTCNIALLIEHCNTNTNKIPLDLPNLVLHNLQFVLQLESQQECPATISRCCASTSATEIRRGNEEMSRRCMCVYRENRMNELCTKREEGEEGVEAYLLNLKVQKWVIAFLCELHNYF